MYVRHHASARHGGHLLRDIAPILWNYAFLMASAFTLAISLACLTISSSSAFYAFSFNLFLHFLEVCVCCLNEKLEEFFDGLVEGLGIENL